MSKDTLNLFKPQVLPNFDLIELENVCRICLHPAANMLSLFDKGIASLISEFLPQKLRRKSLQPHQICAKCFEQAKIAYTFKKQCEYSDELIKSVLNESNINKTCEKQTQTDISNFICLCENKFESEILKELHNTPNISRNCGNHKCHLCEKFFTGKSRLKRHLFDVHNINEYFATKDAINKANEDNESVFVRVFEVSSSNWLEIINDSDKNKIEVVPVSKENECYYCYSIFEDNLQTDDKHEENTVEKNKEIFDSESEIETEKLLTEELEVSQKTVEAMINIKSRVEPKEKITREVKTNVNPKRQFTEIARTKPYLCWECGASFANSNPLKVHIMRHRGQKPFKCRYCDKVFATTSEQYKHETTHKEERNYHCTVCFKAFKRYDNLQVHMRIHTGERPYKCSRCPKAFALKTNLQQHFMRHTGQRRELCYCDLCSLSYSTSQQLLNHKRKVHGIDKTNICSECGTSFKKSEYLKMHIIRTHTNEKPYKCQYCDKAFASLTSLYRHKKTHTGKKNHQCTNCPKAFLTSYQLRAHTRIHTGERPYKCSYCPMVFSENRSLKKHREKHTGE